MLSNPIFWKCLGVALWLICSGAAWRIGFNQMTPEKRRQANEDGTGCLLLVIGPIALLIDLGEWLAGICGSRDQYPEEEDEDEQKEE